MSAPNRQRSTRRALEIVLVAAMLLGLLAFCSPAAAQAQQRVQIPQASALHRHRVEQVVANVWGVDASPARLAAQLHQESGWRTVARSPVGA